MSENNLLQLAQVITDYHSSPPSSPSCQRPIDDRQQQQQPFPIRKNACIVCSVCFTCSKLHPQDQEDYAFSLDWLSRHAHRMYKDNTGQLVGLRDLSEVSLCKAHSSTLYRAKKRHEKNMHETATTSTTTTTTTPPSPSSSSSLPPPKQMQPTHVSATAASGGGLAAKVLEIMHQEQYQPRTTLRPPPPPPPPLPPQADLRLQPSTSLKRKRPTPPPHSSASTPLYATAPLMFHRPSSSSLLPPLHQDQHQQGGRNTSLNSLSSSLQEQLYLSNEPVYKRHPSSPPSPPPALRRPIVETVSLKAMPGPPSSPPQYYFRNLAITDSFTFRDLLREIEMGPTPPNKRIIVLDDKSEIRYPLDQAIRNVITRPSSSHIELCVGLGDKASIDWSNYT
ncbi:hypothetical protein BX666DRAFT_1197604 [Dichotomocladium elegans]|nr:hypothetical protein BX666DRAFT_1197604 [Dichotomocladium elegans]